MIKLDIISDPICPWCYIGKTNLDRALEQVPDHPFEIEWHPFMLNPDMPEGGMDRKEYLELKFGGRQGAIDAYAPIVDAAEKAGLKIDFAGIQRTPSTVDAHRLIHWAGIEGRQTAVVSSLFRAYFTEARDIGDIDVLSDIADSCGLDAAMIRQLLQGDADREDIRARDRWAREHGVSGVPTFVVGQRHAVPGAQPPELWVQVIEELKTSAE
ncbi:DsbA family oxidoreductase [Pseudoruegeria sp. HB172150]|uniref:DsbA family oxidoreductase n=1 Tax=Pseudoruegeria sp. HB172150 TaxID=2721164 RepID=UPI001554FE58|nr:DsbA family oxidoreductase [Pseudoruegeria sp. HB172150]